MFGRTFKENNASFSLLVNISIRFGLTACPHELHTRMTRAHKHTSELQQKICNLDTDRKRKTKINGQSRVSKSKKDVRKWETKMGGRKERGN